MEINKGLVYATGPLNEEDLNKSIKNCYYLINWMDIFICAWFDYKEIGNQY